MGPVTNAAVSSLPFVELRYGNNRCAGSCHPREAGRCLCSCPQPVPALQSCPGPRVARPNGGARWAAGSRALRSMSSSDVVFSETLITSSLPKLLPAVPARARRARGSPAAAWRNPRASAEPGAPRPAPGTPGFRSGVRNAPS